ncbi:hypothetical protein [Leptolyngbya sp. FACHB-17]|uniref:hypothetical protein n=1 Tax=unclassified Leptolyngbya TaxID=2650499 RepID=UPI00168017E5|nr:hypothetical protein [Leptolyngbya sp. FACHB-17]MBD2078854.1 hypothetical protein [Leptolyngbya sp. FACHB-17]
MADSFTDSAAVTTTLKLSFNTAPSLGADVSLGSILENAVTAGEAISTLLENQFSDPDTNSSLKGIAIVGNTAPSSQGSWQYSPDGSNWAVVGGASETSALVLSATTKLRFVPAAFYNGTPDSLTIRAIDNTYTGSFSTVTTTFSGGYMVGNTRLICGCDRFSPPKSPRMGDFEYDLSHSMFNSV